MALRRSFLALAMARAGFCLRQANTYAGATTTWSARQRHLDGGGNLLSLHQIILTPSLTSSSPSSLINAPASTRTTSQHSSSSLNASPASSQKISQSTVSHPRTRSLHWTGASSRNMKLYWRRRGAARWKGEREALFVGAGLAPTSPTIRGRCTALESIRDNLVGVRAAASTSGGRQGGFGHRGVVTMAQPRKKLPERSVDVFCQKCRTQLYKYKKGGKGSLVKCYKERIVEDFTGGKLECPSCGQLFARDTMVHGRPAFKMIGGKVYQKK